MRKFLKNQKGVTMIEVLVTIAILAIVVVPCLSSFVMAQRGNVKAAETKAAYTAAANLMEELKAIPYESEDPGKWKDQVEAAIADVQENESDAISVYYEFINSHYEITIYSGEHAQEPDQNSGIEPIIKGVIAP